jgi:hypothetical protein
MSARSVPSASLPDARPDALDRELAERRLPLRADAADHVALVREQVLRDRPALVELADQVSFGTCTLSKNVCVNGE